MATHFQPYCITCEVGGPPLRHNGSGVFLWPRPPVPASPMVRSKDGQQQWDEFLMEHEFHDLRLLREAFFGWERVP